MELNIPKDYNEGFFDGLACLSQTSGSFEACMEKSESRSRQYLEGFRDAIRANTRTINEWEAWLQKFSA